MRFTNTAVYRSLTRIGTVGQENVCKNVTEILQATKLHGPKTTFMDVKR